MGPDGVIVGTSCLTHWQPGIHQIILCFSQEDRHGVFTEWSGNSAAGFMSSMSSFAGFKFTFTHFAYFLGLKLPPNTSSLSWLAGAAGNPQDFEVGNGGSGEKLYSHVEYVYNAGRCEIWSSRYEPSADWWFRTFFIFPYICNNHPSWLIFFRGVETTNQ